MAESSFEWNNGTITVSSATGRTRNKYWSLIQLIVDDLEDDRFESDAAIRCLTYLSRIKRVDGDVGFFVPLETATQTSVVTFIEYLLDAPEMLVVSFNDAIAYTNRVGDPDLVPPELLDEKKEMIPLPD